MCVLVPTDGLAITIMTLSTERRNET